MISAYLYRPFTIYITRAYIALGLRSNTVTFHSLIAGLAAAALVMFPGPVFLFAAAVCLQIYFILDHVDGEVARFDMQRGRQRPSLAGEFFDFWTHFHSINLIFTFMGLGLFLETGKLIWAVLGIVACNISANFQRMPLANVVLAAVARRRVNIDDPKLLPILDVCCGFSQERRFSGKLPFTKATYLFLSEFFGFPGNVIALTGVLLGDALLSLYHPGTYFLRATYLVFYCIYGLISKTARTVISIRQLKEVPIQQ